MGSLDFLVHTVWADAQADRRFSKLFPFGRPPKGVKQLFYLYDSQSVLQYNDGTRPLPRATEEPFMGDPENANDWNAWVVGVLRERSDDLDDELLDEEATGEEAGAGAEAEAAAATGETPPPPEEAATPIAEDNSVEKVE